MENTINFFKDLLNQRFVVPIALVALVLISGGVGYGMASIGSNDSQRAQIESPQVLGVSSSNEYSNPFETVDVKLIKFPISQLRGCRNWTECFQFCTQPDNFPACSAWSKS